MMGNGKIIGYVLRRLLYLPLGLLALTLLIFWLRESAPGDPVDHLLGTGSRRAATTEPALYLRSYRQLARKAGWDRPAFYFSIVHGGLPDTLHRVPQRAHRRALRELGGQYGNWPAVQRYYRTVFARAYGERVPPQLRTTALKLLRQSEEEVIRRQLATLPDSLGRSLITAYAQLREAARPGRVWIPRLVWHGSANRYHRYLTDLIGGEWGNSLVDRRPVATKLVAALPRTALLNGLALLLVYLLAIPLGMYMARFAGSRFDRWGTVLLFLAFGIPSFWVATLLANFFTTPAFGMDWFPSMGFGRPPPGAGFWVSLRLRVAHLILPVFCLVYPSLAYVARHLRAAARTELDKPYVRNAYMQGLSENDVLWNQVFRNASFPLITLLGSLLPALLAGSVLIERIFNIPGMGMLLYEAALAGDWPVLTVVILLNGLLTMGGLLIADIAYVIADPRIRFAQWRGR